MSRDYDPSKLSVELVPRTAWWSNVRSNVTRAQWEVCKRFTRHKSGGRCEICGGVGRRWPTEAHEVWHYDDEQQIQTLIDLVALCPKCHLVKHFGRAEVIGRGDEAFEWLRQVNGWTDKQTARYLVLVNQIWEIRSGMTWELDVSYLSMLGIDATVQDRA